MENAWTCDAVATYEMVAPEIVCRPLKAGRTGVPARVVLSSDTGYSITLDGRVRIGSDGYPELFDASEVT